MVDCSMRGCGPCEAVARIPCTPTCLLRQSRLHMFDHLQQHARLWPTYRRRNLLFCPHRSFSEATGHLFELEVGDLGRRAPIVQHQMRVGSSRNLCQSSRVPSAITFAVLIERCVAFAPQVLLLTKLRTLSRTACLVAANGILAEMVGGVTVSAHAQACPHSTFLPPMSVAGRHLFHRQ